MALLTGCNRPEENFLQKINEQNDRIADLQKKLKENEEKLQQTQVNLLRFESNQKISFLDDTLSYTTTTIGTDLLLIEKVLFNHFIYVPWNPKESLKEDELPHLIKTYHKEFTERGDQLKFGYLIKLTFNHTRPIELTLNRETKKTRLSVKELIFHIPPNETVPHLFVKTEQGIYNHYIVDVEGFMLKHSVPYDWKTWGKDLLEHDALLGVYKER
jgi:hypothetical protein